MPAKFASIVGALLLTLPVCSPGLRATPDSLPPPASPALEREVDALIKTLEHEDREVRYRALKRIAEIGPPAHRAVPKVLELLTNDLHRFKGRYYSQYSEDKGLPFLLPAEEPALQAIGYTGISYYLEGIKKKDRHYRRACVDILRYVPPKPEDLPGITPLLQDEYGEVRSGTLFILADLKEEAATHAPDIVRALRSGLQYHPDNVAYAFIQLGKDTVPQLKDLATDANPKFREIAAKALRILARKDKRALSILEQLKRDPNPTVRQATRIPKPTP